MYISLFVIGLTHPGAPDGLPPPPVVGVARFDLVHHVPDVIFERLRHGRGQAGGGAGAGTSTNTSAST